MNDEELAALDDAALREHLESAAHRRNGWLHASEQDGLFQVGIVSNDDARDVALVTATGKSEREAMERLARLIAHLEARWQPTPLAFMIEADDGQGGRLKITARNAALGTGGPFWTLHGDNYGDATIHRSDADAKTAAAHWIATGKSLMTPLRCLFTVIGCAIALGIGIGWAVGRSGPSPGGAMWIVVGPAALVALGAWSYARVCWALDELDTLRNREQSRKETPDYR